MKINTQTLIIGAAIAAGAAYFLLMKKKSAAATQTANGLNRIGPNAAATAPSRTDWGSVLGDAVGANLGKVVDKWLSSPPSGGARAIYNEAGTGDVDLTDYLGNSKANASVMDDTLGSWFGGASPRFNWDNAGGSIFDGVPSLGTGLTVD